VTESQWPVHPAAELFPLLGEAELAELAEDIRANGLHEPIWLWDDPERGTVLLDGRNRYAACRLVGVAETTQRYIGDDPITFSISRNMKRRHLTTGQKAAVAEAAEPLIAAQTRQREVLRKSTSLRDESGTQIKATEADLPQSPKPKRAPQSRDIAATVAGTSGRAVAQFKRVKQQAPDLAEKVRTGDLALDRAERIIRDREAEQRRIEQARREAEAQPERTVVDVRHGDFRDVLADLRGVDAIITDPPYPGEYLPLLDDLAAWADKALSPDGVLAVLMGQTHLPEVYRRLDGHRPYRWTACYLTLGAGYASQARRCQSNWKPLLVYGGGPRFADIIRSEGTDAGAKSHHKWGQDYGAFHTIVERFTSRGQTVVDPFMGSGTTLLAAHALGRHAIGCDVDPEHVATARERLA
jgi:16S rRNA G966 N2-methylase RsmD